MKKYIYLLILTFFSSSVLAEGFYAGIGYLKSDVNTHKYPSLTYSAYDDEDDGITIFGGYDFNERFGIEAGYNDLGETTATVTTGPTYSWKYWKPQINLAESCRRCIAMDSLLNVAPTCSLLVIPKRWHSVKKSTSTTS